MTTKDDQLKAWRQSPYRLLVCMPFAGPKIVLEAWQSYIQPTLTSLGRVARIDWSTDDWVRDLREVATESAFVLVDLTNIRPAVQRELNFLLQEKIPLICYMNRPQEITQRITTIGVIKPKIATKHGGSLDLKTLSYPVYTANYTKSKELYDLCNYLKDKLIPFHDEDDPSLPYVNSDISLLPPQEKEGFLLARIPRSRITDMSDYWRKIGEENYWERAQRLFTSSAIYRARVFSWLETSNLLLKTSKNLWIREHLLWFVRDDVISGNRLTSNEQYIIAQLEQAEPVEDIRFVITEIMMENKTAINQALAVQQGMPPVPPPKKLSQSPEIDERILIKLEFCSSYQPVGLKASEWNSGFPNSEGAILNQIKGAASETLRPRKFNVNTVGKVPSHLSGNHMGEIEDAIDQLVPKLATFALNMIDTGWISSDIETTIRVVISLKVMQELDRRGPKIDWGEQYHQDLQRYLGRIWDRDPKDFYLFEFSSSHYESHFRGLLLWPDIRESTIRLMTKVSLATSKSLSEQLSEDAAYERALKWDLPPMQLWGVTLLKRMHEVVPKQTMRKLWAKYVLPTAFFYCPFEMIFVDPDKVDQWAYC